MPVGQTQRAEFKYIVFEQFEKLNTQSVRQALKESELAFLENLQPIAPNNLAVVPAVAAAALATLPVSMLSMFYGLVNGVDYYFAFCSDGSAYAINIATGIVNNFASPGTFSNAPDLTTWQSSRVLINDLKSGYVTFDGNIFVQQGGVSPNIVMTAFGSGYGSPPPVTISGGSGVGATAISSVSGGAVVGVALTNPGIGFKAGDTLTVTFGTSVGSGAAGHVTMSGFNIASLSLSNPGFFTFPPNGTYALTFTGGGGTGAAGTATVQAIGGGNFNVPSVSLTAGGTGYTSAPTVTLSTGVSGFPPTITANLGTENVASIVLDAGGSGYLAPPVVTISGGLGAGGVAATAHSTLSGTSVNALILDTNGSGYVATPSVIIGAGSGAAASARVWPFVPKGTTLAVFQGRVWLGGPASAPATGGLLQWTGTGAGIAPNAQGFDDFTAAGASASLVISDADLIHTITALRSANNYLYIMGDQSVKQIGNISLNSTGNVTLFTILTLSSDQGTIWPRSCGSYNRVFMFANSNGVYGVFGSSVQKISDDLDGIFSTTDKNGNLVPGIDFGTTQQAIQAAILDLKNIHNIAFLVRYIDPLSSERSLLLIFNGKKWWLASQGNSLVTMATSALLSTGKTQLFGSSGTDITQLFAAPSVPVSFKWQSSLTHHGNAIQRKKVLRAGFAVTMGATGQVTFSIDSDEGSNTYTQTIAKGFRALAFGTDTGSKSIDGAGRYLGMTITGTLANFTGSNMQLEYQETNVGNRNTA